MKLTKEKIDLSTAVAAPPGIACGTLRPFRPPAFFSRRSLALLRRRQPHHHRRPENLRNRGHHHHRVGKRQRRPRNLASASYPTPIPTSWHASRVGESSCAKERAAVWPNGKKVSAKATGLPTTPELRLFGDVHCSPSLIAVPSAVALQSRPGGSTSLDHKAHKCSIPVPSAHPLR